MKKRIVFPYLAGAAAAAVVLALGLYLGCPALNVHNQGLWWLLGGGLLGHDMAAGWRIFRRDRYKHASPNSAQTESVCAGLLGLRLAGDAWYHGQLHKKEYIGDPVREIEYEDIPRACRLLYATAVLALVLGVAVRFLILR